MRVTHRWGTALGAIAATASALLIAPGTAQAADVERAAWECPKGYVCFWTKAGGKGTRCYVDVDIPRWTTAACNDYRFMSVFNNAKTNTGEPAHVRSYRGYDYTGERHHFVPGAKSGLASDPNPRGVRMRSVAWAWS
ncbi:peptidase inhibitor family I36 protein [Streptomyces sp. NPDC041068]|uniref:peptidase inhibitor family I36 protein n=1 Tax=Streptomyces sp. NPDC041068 TaxID=3155130 RepID=UPI0033FB8105